MNELDTLVRFALAGLLVLVPMGCGSESGGGGHEGHDHGEGEHDEEGGEHDEEGGEHEHEGEIRLSAAAIEASGIRVGTVERRALSGGAGLPAELSFDPLSTAHVSPLASGRFTRIEVALGEHVTEGQLLATVVSGTASEAGSLLAQTRARLVAAETSLARQRQLVDQGIGAQRALIEAEATVAGLRAESQGLSRQLRVLGSGRGGLLRLEAPIAGVVTQVHATPGESASPTQPAFTIADPAAISVYVQVPELAISRVSEGLITLFRPHAFPELSLRGTVQYLAPDIDTATRSLSMRVALDQVDPRLRSGMYGSVELIGDGQRSLAVPTSAVVTMNGTTTVFIPGDAEGEFRPTPVHIGRRAGSHYELLEGLEEGDSVVVAGAFTLKSAGATEQLAEHHH